MTFNTLSIIMEPLMKDYKSESFILLFQTGQYTEGGDSGAGVM